MVDQLAQYTVCFTLLANALVCSSNGLGDRQA
jgi:hypothetical protein